MFVIYFSLIRIEPGWLMSKINAKKFINRRARYFCSVTRFVSAFTPISRAMAAIVASRQLPGRKTLDCYGPIIMGILRPGICLRAKLQGPNRARAPRCQSRWARLPRFQAHLESSLYSGVVEGVSLVSPAGGLCAVALSGAF